MSVPPAPVKMRRCFADALHQKMRGDRRIWVVTADLGYKMWDPIRRDFAGRFLNVGAAEQAMLGMCVGLATEGKIPFAYSITTFLLYRPFETIRNYLDRDRLPVKLVGSGRGRDYHHDGFSHWAEEDRAVMRVFGNIRSRWPETHQEIPALVEEMIEQPFPYYINLRK